MCQNATLLEITCHSSIVAVVVSLLVLFVVVIVIVCMENEEGY